MSEQDKPAHEAHEAHETSPGDPQHSGAVEAADTSAPARDSVTADRHSEKMRRTRVGGAWTAVAVAVVVLLLLLIFILQNLRTIGVTYFGASGQLPLGVALLLAAVGGALFVIVLGAARILQLRAFAWRQRRRYKQAGSPSDRR